jgi:hypothetical protein
VSDDGHLITADRAVCSRMAGLHLSSARARQVVQAAQEPGEREDVIRAVAEELRSELFIEQRLLEAAIDVVRAVRGES